MTQTSQAISKALSELRELWNETLGDDAVCIAIFDGPVDLTHPCFAGSHLTEIWTLASADVATGADLAHGTHVACMMFGQHHDSVQGISPGSRDLIILIFGEFNDGEPIPRSQVDLARAIYLAIQSGADLVDISGGQFTSTGTAHPILAGAIQKCIESGVLLVAAAGNQDCDCLHIPSALPAVLPVGAMDREGMPLTFSNWGEAYRVHGVLALGAEILGALPGGGVTRSVGTSYATSVVSGLVALLMSAYLKEHNMERNPARFRCLMRSWRRRSATIAVLRMTVIDSWQDVPSIPIPRLASIPRPRLPWRRNRQGAGTVRSESDCER